jgi:hypothetical protein
VPKGIPLSHLFKTNGPLRRIRFSWQRFIVVIIIVISICFLYQPMYDYLFGGCKYEFSMYAENKRDNRVIFMGILTLTTPKAFIPLEKIRAKAKVVVYDDSLENKWKKSKELMVHLWGSSDLREDASDFKYIAGSFAGYILLHETGSRIFEGETDIKYLRPDSYGYTLLSSDLKMQYFDKKDGIVIGSTTDLLSKRTNDLLLYLAFMTFVLMIYIEFFRKSNA